MHYTSRQDFPGTLPDTKTQYCWHCKSPGAQKTGTDPVEHACAVCGRTSPRVLIHDPNMQAYFDDNGRLVHESCGFILVRRDGKLLLFKRTKFPYLLTIPAGHLEQGEDPAVCAVRETEEEVGVTPTESVELFNGTIEGDSCLGGADIHLWYAYGSLLGDDASVKLDGEGSSWGWYDRAELNAENTVQPLLYLLADKEVIDKLQRLTA
jgi:8-oxo-dGTP pyrophosphatase MutT (NUDIX family)